MKTVFVALLLTAFLSVLGWMMLLSAELIRCADVGRIDTETVTVRSKGMLPSAHAGGEREGDPAGRECHCYLTVGFFGRRLLISRQEWDKITDDVVREGRPVRLCVRRSALGDDVVLQVMED